MEQRKIIHIDMDAFYASIEQRDNPAYRANLSPSDARKNEVSWPRPATRLANLASIQPCPP